VEKLDEILRAEESARHALVDARARARDMRREAAAEAELIAQAGSRKAAEDAGALRAKILTAADAEAAAAEREAEHQLGLLVRGAEQRLDAAVSAVVREITG
jgi:vacuolar-type H+-ATPase subunit H